MQIPDIREGDQVQPGMPVADVLDLSELEIVAKIGELDRANLNEGQDVNIRLDAIGDKTFHGKIKSMSGTASANIFSGDPGKKFDVVFSLDMKELLVRPGREAGADPKGAGDRRIESQETRAPLVGWRHDDGRRPGGPWWPRADAWRAAAAGRHGRRNGCRSGGGAGGCAGGRRRMPRRWRRAVVRRRRSGEAGGAGGGRMAQAMSPKKTARRCGRRWRRRWTGRACRIFARRASQDHAASCQGDSRRGQADAGGRAAAGDRRRRARRDAAAAVAADGSREKDLQTPSCRRSGGGIQLEVLLRPGLLADVEIIVEKIPNAINVPTQAVFEKDGKQIVYVQRQGLGRARDQLVKRSESGW